MVLLFAVKHMDGKLYIIGEPSRCTLLLKVLHIMHCSMAGMDYLVGFDAIAVAMIRIVHRLPDPCAPLRYSRLG
jgi:hypothetical protein